MIHRGAQGFDAIHDEPSWLLTRRSSAVAAAASFPDRGHVTHFGEAVADACRRNETVVVSAPQSSVAGPATSTPAPAGAVSLRDNGASPDALRLIVIAYAHTLRPDVILMDIAMPHMDGIEATSRIRA